MASWDIIVETIEQWGISTYLKNTIKDYFRKRKVQIDKNKVIEVGRGVPQGSVLGPILSNILYDDVMTMDVPEGVTLSCYADDLAAVITTENKEELQMKGEVTLVEGTSQSWYLN